MPGRCRGQFWAAFFPLLSSNRHGAATSNQRLAWNSVVPSQYNGSSDTWCKVPYAAAETQVKIRPGLERQLLGGERRLILYSLLGIFSKWTILTQWQFSPRQLERAAFADAWALALLTLKGFNNLSCGKYVKQPLRRRQFNEFPAAGRKVVKFLPRSICICVWASIGSP